MYSTRAASGSRPLIPPASAGLRTSPAGLRAHPAGLLVPPPSDPGFAAHRCATSAAHYYTVFTRQGLLRLVLFGSPLASFVSRRNLRKTTMVKFRDNKNEVQFAEIQYFFRLAFGDDVHSLAAVSVFSPPDCELLKKSYQTVYVCHYQGDHALLVIDVKQIDSVVSRVPYFKLTPNGDIVTPETEFFLLEKLGLDITCLLGEMEEDEGPDDGDMSVDDSD
ncbi:hypothetical protein LshimejAT787_0110340 [Lyophyllum shimeji]|uniref:Uncharacterized protein n=1 Tax=Lyophyllum shimeji TaxID=47721 RepID=A0A9P3UK64_LYOSH|nr:hypothetical protein LshimejAT787_0110340 [Lyophyllum shimeji]